MKKKDFNWKDYHHSMYQIYHGMIAITLIPFALLFLEWDSGSSATEVDHSSVLFLAVVQILWIIALAFWYSWKKLAYEFDDETDLIGKLTEFRKKNLRKYAALTVAGVLASFAMWVQPSFLFVVAYLLVLVRFSFLRPSEDKIVRDMQLTRNDRKFLHEK